MSATDDQKEQDAFFNKVVNALHQKHGRYVEFHWPSDLCAEGECAQPGLSRTNLATQECNWDGIQILVSDFFRVAPEVPQGWKWNAWKIGLPPDRFHDLLIGIFLGSDTPRVHPIQTEWFPPEKPKFGSYL